MNKICIKAVIIMLLSFLVLGCAVYIRDGHHHHYRRGYYHWHGSSLDSPIHAEPELVLNQKAHHLDWANDTVALERKGMILPRLSNGG